MGWIRLDDGFLDHPKFLEAGPLAGFLNIAAIAWSARNNTDGFVPRVQVRRLVDFEGYAWEGEMVGGGEDAAAPDLAEHLVHVGLWRRVEGGFEIHDYLDWQRSAADREAARGRAVEAGRKGGRAKSGKRPASESLSKTPSGLFSRTLSESSSESPSETQAEAECRVQRQRQRTETSTETSEPDGSDTSEHRHSPTIEQREADPKIVAAAELLAELIEVGGSKPPGDAQRKRWRRDVRLMVEQDGRTLDQIEAAIRWSQQHPFWRSNVLSMGKLREQFDQMRLQAERGKSGGSAVAEGNKAVLRMLREGTAA